MKKFNLNGYTHSFSKSGEMSLVKQPPWFFGGDLIEIISEVKPESVRDLIPEPLKINNNKSFLSVTMVNMISAASKEEYLESPEKSQYKECLIKIYCQFKGNNYWFVPISWVTTDFSLLRGYVMGFGKRIGTINITRLHQLNPLSKDVYKKGMPLIGMCHNLNDIAVKIKLNLDKKNNDDMFAGTGMIVMRHFPFDSRPAIHELSRLKVTDYVRENYWSAKGEVLKFESGFEELNKISLGRVVCARTFQEGFRLLGTETIYNYQ